MNKVQDKSFATIETNFQNWMIENANHWLKGEKKKKELNESYTPLINETNCGFPSKMSNTTKECTTSSLPFAFYNLDPLDGLDSLYILEIPLR